MTFEIFILAVTMKAISFCESTFIPTSLYACTESVVECVLDGERISFCTEAYLEEIQNARINK